MTGSTKQAIEVLQGEIQDAENMILFCQNMILRKRRALQTLIGEGNHFLIIEGPNGARSFVISKT